MYIIYDRNHCVRTVYVFASHGHVGPCQNTKGHGGYGHDEDHGRPTGTGVVVTVVKTNCTRIRIYTKATTMTTEGPGPNALFVCSW